MQMFPRGITTHDVITIIKSGEIIRNYTADNPYPSMLILGFIDKRPVHVVLANNEPEKTCIIITTYIPDQEIWNSDYKTRKEVI